MKPLKSLLFLFGAIAVLSAAHFLLKRLGHEGFSDWESAQPAPVQQSLHERWQQDSLMLLYQRIYRFPEHAPSSARLQDIPLAPFQYDTTGAGRRLLRQFFAKLLMLSHPEQAQLIQNCYPDPVFWNENLANNRPYFVRILCYEGAYAPDNRISGTLRQLIQSDFGGSGPDIIPLSQPASSLDPEAKNDLFRIKTSDTWHEVASATDTRRGNFGIMTYYLGPPPLNALATASHSQDIGQIRIDLPPVFQNYPGLCMEAFVHEDVLPKDIKISISGNSSRQNPKESSPENILPASVLKCPGQQRLSYPLPQNTQNILLQLVLKRNRNLYAIAFNDTVGVSVDNIFLPRNKGKVFSVNNRRFLTDQMLLANVGLILYHELYPKPDAIYSYSLDRHAGFIPKVAKFPIGYARLDSNPERNRLPDGLHFLESSRNAKKSRSGRHRKNQPQRPAFLQGIARRLPSILAARTPGNEHRTSQTHRKIPSRIPNALTWIICCSS